MTGRNNQGDVGNKNFWLSGLLLQRKLKFSIKPLTRLMATSARGSTEENRRLCVVDAQKDLRYG
jgi:hypothetical protein